MNELHLKFHSDTGNKTTEQFYTNQGTIDAPTDEYMEWLEELALKQVRSEGKFPKEFRYTFARECIDGYFGDMTDDDQVDDFIDGILDRIEKYFKNGV